MRQPCPYTHLKVMGEREKKFRTTTTKTTENRWSMMPQVVENKTNKKIKQL
jgi:hypothetical protein